MMLQALRHVAAFTLLAALGLSGPALAQGEAHSRWGLYAGFADSTWISRIDTGHSALIRYSWAEPGRVLKAEHRVSGAPGATVETITLGARPDQLAISTSSPGEASPSLSTVTLRPDGSAVETYVGLGGQTVRATYTPMGPDRYRALAEAEVDGAWRKLWGSEVTRLPNAPPGG